VQKGRGQTRSLLRFSLEMANGFRLFIGEASPFFVVVTRDHASVFGDENFRAPPKVNGNEKGFEPAVGDAIVAIEGHLVVFAVSRGREDDASLLKNDGNERGLLHVRPGMELIREGNPKTSPNPEVEHEERPSKDGTVRIANIL